jgi:aspartyl-tRNA(Asn)/glutamyl-tRNA(Gln) amidotransferase subunit A
LGISIACGFTKSGLPIGMQLIGRPFDEALLLQIAHAYEAVSTAGGRWPPVVQRG